MPSFGFLGRPRNRLRAMMGAGVAAAGLSVGGQAPARGAEYQFGFEIEKPADDPLLWTRTAAFLWVPPKAPAIRAVVLAPANIIERRFCDDPIVRDEAEADGLALLFFQAGWKGPFVESARLPGFVEGMLGRFAEISGYDELRTVPWVPLGHSGNSAFVASLARQRPDRTLASVVVKGAAPGVGRDGSTAGLAGIPTLFVTGQFEEVMPPGRVRDAWWGEQMKRVQAARAAVPDCLFTGVLDRSHGHVDWSPDLSRYVALYLHKAVAARLGATGGPRLAAVPFSGGWLSDPAGVHRSAPASRYDGPPSEAFWHFDEEAARAWQGLADRDRGKKEQLLAFAQDGVVAPWWSGWGVQGLEFRPRADGVTFSVSARFRDEVPAPFADAGAKLGHGDPARIAYRVLGWAGATEQVGPDTFRVRFDREGVNGRTVHVVLGAFHPGDAEYRETVAVARLEIPYSHASGARQTIAFPPIPDVPADASTVPLRATVDSGLRPDYYVSWGPAEVDGDSLRLTPLPLRARSPVEVRVTAYQWGKSTPPPFATAPPVTRTFHVLRPPDPTPPGPPPRRD